MRRLILLLMFLLMTSNCWALQKNVASQKWIVFAFDETDNTAKIGDAAQITANLRIDGAAANDVDDLHPTELEDGYYVFDITNTESDGDSIVICPDSTTANIQVIGCPMALWTTPPYFPTMSIDSNGRLDIIKVAGTTQTANDMSGDIDDILIDTAAIEPIATDLQGFSELGDKIVADMDANSVLANGTYGLSALETLVDEVETLLKSATYGLSALESLVDDIGVAGAGLTAINLPNQTMDIVGNITGNLSGSIGTLTGGVDLVKIHGSAITETSSGMFAANWDTFFDNVDSATAKTLDDIGGAAGLEVDITKIHGTAITEPTGGRIAGNFSTFWGNADAATSKVVDNVGASAAGGGSSLVLNVGNLGNFKEDNTVVFAWRSIDQGGAAVNPSVAGTIKIYKENSDIEITAPTGMTDTRGFDGLTGIHLLVIDLGANSFYARNQDYSVVLTGATVDSQTTTAVIATFSIEKRYVDEFER